MEEVLYATLVKGGAWLAILKGLWATVEISVLSILLGTLLGAAVCCLRLQKNVVLKGVVSVYTAVLRGSPVLLLLMLMYYVIFARSTLSAPHIAVIAFSLNVSAHMAECFRAAYAATDKMQVQAARTLGFSKAQAFRLISLPQMIKVAKPTYQSLIVNLIQWTSVVGYVSITDLTTVINNIGSRTMQPLLMICVGIVLYLALSYLTYGVFALAGFCKRAKAERRNRA